MKEEIWKSIKGYEGWYEVSNMGRVRSLDRTVYFKDGKRSRTYKGKILQQKYHNGYARVNLLKNKDLKVVYVHRMVLETFVPKVVGKTWCNHKNGIKSDNRVENLEWCTPSENNKHVIENGLRQDNVDGLIKYTDTLKKKVIAIKNNRMIYSADCSRDMAIILKRYEPKIFAETSLQTIGRSVRKSALEGNIYKGFFFQYV